MAAPDQVVWRRLWHARGPASDVPGRLAGLCGPDEQAASDALTFVWTHLLDEGRPTAATAPALRLLGGMLDDPALGAGDTTVREGLLVFLREVARLVDDHATGRVPDEPSPDRQPADRTADEQADRRETFVLSCADVLPEVFPALWPVPSAWPSRARALAASAASMLVRHPALTHRRTEVVALHQQAARDSTDRWECACYLLGLGELGVAPRAWLADERLGVRVCAALAPALADDDTATEVLVRAAEHPRAFDHAFEEPFVAPPYRLRWLPQFRERASRVLIRTVCERVADFRRLVLASVAAVHLRGPYRPEPEFGPYLSVAFPTGLPATLTRHQQAFARAIAERDELWDGTCHRVAEMFAAVDLPYDRVRYAEARTTPEVGNRTDHTSLDLVPLTAARLVRDRPAMFLGVARSSPDLLRNLLDVVVDAATTVRVEGPRRFAVEVDRTAPALAEIAAISAGASFTRHYGLSLAAALSLWVTWHVQTDGIAFRQEFVDGVPTGPPQPLDPTDDGDVYRVLFELDGEWLPPGARLPD